MISLWLLVLQVLFTLLFVELGLTSVTDVEWARYKARYNKRYGLEDQYHRRILEKRVQAVANHNRLYSQGRSGFRMGLNQFSDTNLRLLYSRRSAISAPAEPSTKGVTKPANYKSYDQITRGIDWRQYGYISAVGDQGTECLSCWAFSTSGVLEAHLAKKYGKLVPLSPKHFVDCVPYPNQGCNAGWVSVAFNYTRDYGIASKESYPYKPENGECRWDPRKSAGTLREYVTLTSNDERELAEVVYNIGPVAVSIDHLHEEFDQYFGGILRIPSCGNTKFDLKHSVLLVGFGTHPKWGDYWIIKNSYGTEWGESGYFKLARNANNMCGVATLPQYPIV
ncbi:cathepsin L1 [Drosophila sechellia]|uniref:GM10853 n=1 Tax=Drosophila sechellia TaxID=7238 RepID=B4I4A3_DROSE|nr:cathepsin L1 [Drosophila sechellia]EDW55046.1 GM10853 [Drosophila sechellia]